MAFPIPPTVDIPRWCYSGGTYSEPSLARRQTGWSEQLNGYATIPSYQEENWINYAAGEWINYVAAYAIPYLALGQFDNGIKIYNNQQAKFYNAANDKFTALRSAPTQSVASVELTLPAAIPTTPMPMVSDTAGNLSFSKISSSAVAGITNGSAPLTGQIGEYFVLSKEYLGVPYNVNTVVGYWNNFPTGIWQFSYNSYHSIGNPPSSSFTQNQVSIWINNIAFSPENHAIGYNYITEYSMGQAMTLTLPSYFVKASAPFDIYFGVQARSNTGSGGSNMWFTVTAQRIA